MRRANPLPDLPDREYAALRQSIAERGVLVPVVVSAGTACEGEVADGHHRLRACLELGVECPVEQRSFATEAEFRLYQLEANVRRRHLTVAQRIELGMKFEPWERQLAKDRQGRRTDLEPPGSPTPTSGRSSERVAERVGLRPSTYERGVKVLREAPPEVAEDLRRGASSVNKAWMDFTRRYEASWPRGEEQQRQWQAIRRVVETARRRMKIMGARMYDDPPARANALREVAEMFESASQLLRSLADEVGE